jgi:hypothetical protein
VETRSDELMRSVSNYTRAHPLPAVAIAFGAGYLIAGGVFSRVTGRLLRVGVRLALGQVLHQVIDEARPSPRHVH